MTNHAADPVELRAPKHCFIHHVRERRERRHCRALLGRSARHGRAGGGTMTPRTGATATAASGAPVRVLAFALTAALLYGAVGAFVNRAHGDVAMWNAALVQGGASALTTASLSTLIDLVLVWSRQRTWLGPNGRRLHTWLAPAAVGLLAALLGVSIQAALHWWVATPEPIATVVLPATALLAYCPLYACAAAARAARGQRVVGRDAGSGGQAPWGSTRCAGASGQSVHQADSMWAAPTATGGTEGSRAPSARTSMRCRD